MFRRLLLIVSLLFWANAAQSNSLPKVINLATTEWCPYACEDSSLGQGILFDYFTMILKPHGVKVQLTFLPWAQAIDAVNKGKLDGLLSAIPTEAPDLSFTNVPTMHYKMCVYADKKSAWQYQGASSLYSRKLAVVDGYGYGEPIDSYVRNEANNQHIVLLKGDNSLARLDKLLSSNQIDAFVEDMFVVNWQKRDMKKNSFKIAGCLKPVPFYMAFNNSFAEETQVVELIDKLLSQPKYQNYLNQYMLPHYFKSTIN